MSCLTGAHEEIDYSAKLKFSDDEGDEEGEEEKPESNNDLGYVTKYIQHAITSDIHKKVVVFCRIVIIFDNSLTKVDLVLSEQQRSQDAPPATSRSRASDSSGDSRRTPPSNADNGPQPSSKPGRAEEGGSGWGGQGAPNNYQVVC